MKKIIVFPIALIILLVAVLLWFIKGNQISLTDKTASRGTLCESTDLKLRAYLPSDWTCTFDPIQPGFGTLTMKSGTFDITVSNGGIGFGCNGDENCLTTPYFSSNLIDLELLKNKGKGQYIFGVFKDNSDTKSYGGMSIKYQGIETRELTPSEKTQLDAVLNSLTRIN